MLMVAMVGGFLCCALACMADDFQVYWNFGDVDSLTALPEVTPNNVFTVSALTNGNAGTQPMLSTSPASTGEGGNATASASGGVFKSDESAYFAWTMTPVGETVPLVVTNFSFRCRSSSTGPTAWKLMAVTNNVSREAASGTITMIPAEGWEICVCDDVFFFDGRTPVTFMLYGYGGGSRANQNWRIDDLGFGVTTNMVLGKPKDLAATAVKHDGFTAHWGEVAGAAGYTIDVYRNTNSVATGAHVIISQYVEGRGNNKAIELTNIGDEALELDGYSLRVQSNENEAFGAAYALSGKILAAGRSCLIANNGAQDLTNSIPSWVDKTMSGGNAMTFDGNDAVGLFFDGVLMDCVGVVDSSKYWGENVTLTRSPLVRRQNPVFDEDEWIRSGMNDFTGLGVHVCAVPLAGWTSVAVGNVTNHVVTGLNASTPYSYRVCATALPQVGKFSVLQDVTTEEYPKRTLFIFR